MVAGKENGTSDSSIVANDVLSQQQQQQQQQPSVDRRTEIDISSRDVVVKQVTSRGVATHVISMRGLAGGVLYVLLISILLAVVAMATTSWSSKALAEEGSSHHMGLWESCVCSSREQPNTDWFRAVQAMVIMGLLGLMGTFVIVLVYLCLHSINKDIMIKIVMALCLFPVVCFLIATSIFGAYKEPASVLSWSFGFIVTCMCLSLVAGIISLIQYRRSWQ